MSYLTLEEAAQYINHRWPQQQALQSAELLRAGVHGALLICTPFGFGLMYNATTRENENFSPTLLVLPPTHLLEIETEGRALIKVATSLDGKTIYFPHIERTHDQLRVLVSDLNELIPKLIHFQQAPISEAATNNFPEKELATTSSKNRSINKQKVITAFQGIYWSDSQWNKNLANPPKWLEECRVLKGTRSKNNPSTWNPVEIAIALEGKGISIKKLDAVFVGLNDWRNEWLIKSEYLR